MPQRAQPSDKRGSECGAKHVVFRQGFFKWHLANVKNRDKRFSEPSAYFTVAEENLNGTMPAQCSISSSIHEIRT